MDRRYGMKAWFFLAVFISALCAVDVAPCSTICTCKDVKAKCKAINWAKELSESRHYSPRMVPSASNELTHIQKPCENLMDQFAEVQIIDLSRQNISCDCHMRWLLTWKNASVSHQLLGACFTPPRLAGRQLTELTPDQLDCNELVFNVTKSMGNVFLHCKPLTDDILPTEAIWWMVDDTPLQPSSSILVYNQSFSRIGSQLTCRWSNSQTVNNRPLLDRSLTTKYLSGLSECLDQRLGGGHLINNHLTCFDKPLSDSVLQIFQTNNTIRIKDFTCRRHTSNIRCDNLKFHVRAVRGGIHCGRVLNDDTIFINNKGSHIGYKDKGSFSRQFTSLENGSTYIIHFNFTSHPLLAKTVPVVVSVNGKEMALIQVTPGGPSSGSLYLKANGNTLDVQFDAVLLVPLRNGNYQRPRFIIENFYLVKLKPTALHFEEATPDILPRPTFQKGFSLDQLPIKKANQNYESIIQRIDGIYLSPRSSRTLVSIATDESSKFRFKINIERNFPVIQSHLSQLSISFFSESNNGSLLPFHLSAALNNFESLLNTIDLKLVFTWNKNSKKEDMPRWEASLYYRTLQSNEPFVWNMLNHTVVVGPTQDLQSVLNSIPENGLILLLPGVYKHSLAINRSIHISSTEGVRQTVIRGHVNVTANVVTLEGITFVSTNKPIGVFVSGMNVKIIGCQINVSTSQNGHGRPTGIKVNCNGYCNFLMENTYIKDFYNGLVLRNSHRVIIRNNTLSGNARAVVQKASTIVAYVENIFCDNQLRLLMDAASNRSSMRNTRKSNIVRIRRKNPVKRTLPDIRMLSKRAGSNTKTTTPPSPPNVRLAPFLVTAIKRLNIGLDCTMQERKPSATPEDTLSLVDQSDVCVAVFGPVTLSLQEESEGI